LPQFTVLKAFLCDGTEKGNTDRTCLPPWCKETVESVGGPTLLEFPGQSTRKERAAHRKNFRDLQRVPWQKAVEYRSVYPCEDDPLALGSNYSRVLGTCFAPGIVPVPASQTGKTSQLGRILRRVLPL
jgi:hypothetical protein